MIKRVSVDIYPNDTPGNDLAKWGVHPLSRLNNRRIITGDMVETELFAETLEVEAEVGAFENGRGFTLRVLRAGKPRMK